MTFQFQICMLSTFRITQFQRVHSLSTAPTCLLLICMAVQVGKMETIKKSHPGVRDRVVFTVSLIDDKESHNHGSPSI